MKTAYFFDTNCLLILLIGLIDQKYLRRFTRTKQNGYEEKFSKLRAIFADDNNEIVANSYILSEISHLTLESKNFESDYKKRLVLNLENFINNSKIKIEETEPKKILKNPHVYFLGFTDVSVLETQPKLTLVTLDSALKYRWLDSQNLSVVEV
jgi:hypothetical protein